MFCGHQGTAAEPTQKRRALIEHQKRRAYVAWRVLRVVYKLAQGTRGLVEVR